MGRRQGEYVNVSNHAIDLADGRTVGAGERISNLDLSEPHNQAYVDQKVLVNPKDAASGPKGDESLNISEEGKG